MRRPIYVTTYGAEVGKSGNSLTVKTERETKRIPLGVIEYLVLFPGVEITVPALRFLSGHRRPVFLVNQFGRVSSVVLPEVVGSSTATLRAKQYEKFADANFSVEMIRELLTLKLSKLEELTGSSYPEVRKKIKVARKPETLLGIDGKLGKILYDFLSKKNQSPFPFKGREYYPPPDPVNAVLSLTFTVFYSLLTAAVISSGLDPYLGFFHVRRGVHAALSSDIIEPIRPQIADFVIELFNSGFFEEKDFSQMPKGVKLENSKLKSLLKLIVSFEIDKRVSEPSLNFLKFLKDSLRK